MKSILAGLVIAMSFSSAYAARPTDGLPETLKKVHTALTATACDTELDMAPESFDLGNGNTLYLVPCMFGAYQGSSNGYILNGDYVTQVVVLGAEGKTIVGTLDLTSADYNPKTGILSTFAKGRGIGDCGQTSQTLIKAGEYGGVTVKTIEIRSKSKCDGKYVDTWPVVFKQK